MFHQKSAALILCLESALACKLNRQYGVAVIGACCLIPAFIQVNVKGLFKVGKTLQRLWFSDDTPFRARFPVNTNKKGALASTERVALCERENCYYLQRVGRGVIRWHLNC
jgi:hypothetical protein